jgi:heptosyltransferase-2
LEILKEKILIIQTAFLGDAILTLPMIQQLKKKLPTSLITVLCIPSTKELFEKSPVIDVVIVYDKRNTQKSILSLFVLILGIRKKKYLIVYSPHKSSRSAIIAFLSGAKLTYGFDSANMSFLYTNQIKYQKSDHEVARNLKLIGMEKTDLNWKILPQLEIDSETNAKIESKLKMFNFIKIAAVAPGSVWATKIYPKEYFIKVIQYLLSEDYFIILIGGKEDQDHCAEIEKKFSESVKSFAGLLNVPESICLLKHCSFLISNDSAPTHLGMIADIPTITIYCSTVSAFGFYPYNGKSFFISYDDLACKPCGIHGHQECPIKTFDCGYKLFPEIIISKLKEKNIL